ncbi:MAG: ceramidase domain-containing protein [Myxococcota bacterium]
MNGDCPWPPEVVGIRDFCEAVDPCALVMQPVSTASALAFVPVGAFVVWLAVVRRQPALGLVAGAMLAMAVGTVAQHATGTWAGMVVDHLGMELTNVVLLLLGLRRWRGFAWRPLVVVGLVAVASLVALTELEPALRRGMVVAMMVPSAMVEARLWLRDGATTTYRWLGAGWACFAVGSLCWRLDQGPLCAPSSSVQLHAVWHVASAAAMACWAVFYAQFDSLRVGRVP